MSTLQAKTIVRCPLSQAPVYLDRFFAERSGEDLGRLTLTLRAPLDMLGSRTDMALEREVAVTIERRHDERAGGGPLQVAWHPLGGGPFPAFRGTLTIEADEDYTSSRLALDGEYTPPLGVPGAAFDAALGHRIAQATARDLLSRIGTTIESAYQGAEEVKAASRRTAEAT